MLNNLMNVDILQNTWNIYKRKVMLDLYLKKFWKIVEKLKKLQHILRFGPQT